MMPSSSIDHELFPLSWLSQYGYCPRRCGLLALDQAWEDNMETAAGSVSHQRVHAERIERHGENLLLYEFNVYSHTLGVNGKCDCIEATPREDGVTLPYGPNRYCLYPVEYKHGVVRREEEEYHIQLCAQAMCLEEQFGCDIPSGAVFYINAHRRDEVPLTPELRERTAQTAEAVAELLLSQQIPKGEYTPKCQRCSLISECEPKIKSSSKAYCQKLWQIILTKESE